MSDNLFQKLGNPEDNLPLFKRPKLWFRLAMIVFTLGLLFLLYQFVFKNAMSFKDVQDSIEIVWHDSKWVDKEVTNYEIKIVPVIIIKIKNIGPKPLHNLELQGIFKFIDSEEAHSDGYAMALNKPLQPGETSEEITIKAFFGYSASTKEAFFKNQDKWKNMTVRLAASTKGSGWVPIGSTYEIKQMIEGIDEQSLKAKLAGSQKSFSELAKWLQIVWQDSKWLKKARIDEQVYIVPSIQIKLKNTGQKDIENVILKGLFVFAESDEKLGEGVAVVFSKPLQPDQTSNPIEIISDLGYSASSLDAFYKNISLWKEVKVKILVKSTGLEYVLLGVYPIKKEIEGIKVIYQ